MNIAVFKNSFMLASVLVSLSTSAFSQDIPYLSGRTGTTLCADTPYTDFSGECANPVSVGSGIPFYGPGQAYSNVLPVSVDAPVPGYCLAVNETGFNTLGSLSFRFNAINVAYIANPDRDISATRTLVASAPSECASDNYLVLIESIQFVAPELLNNYHPSYTGPRTGDGKGPFVKIKFVGSEIVFDGRLSGATVSRSPTIAAALEESKATGQAVSIRQ